MSNDTSHINWQNFNPHEPDNFEHPEGKSMAVPNMTLSLKELLERFTRGQAVPQYEMIYNEGEDIDTTGMDKLDLIDLARSGAEEKQNIIEKFKKQIEDGKERAIQKTKSKSKGPEKTEEGDKK